MIKYHTRHSPQSYNLVESSYLYEGKPNPVDISEERTSTFIPGVFVTGM